MLSYHLTYYFASGKPPVRRGAAMQLSPAYRGFQASDDWLVVGAFTDRMWEGVCRATGKVEWIEDPRYLTAADRGRHRLELIEALNAVFATRTVAEWVGILAAEGVPSTPVQSIDQVVEDEQVPARHMVAEVEHPKSGGIKMSGLPIKFSRTPGAIHSSSPMLGQHSSEILLEHGYSTAGISELMNLGVIGASGTWWRGLLLGY